jgi:hypothetical protein
MIGILILAGMLILTAGLTILLTILLAGLSGAAGYAVLRANARFFIESAAMAGQAILWLPIICAIVYRSWIPIELMIVASAIVLPASFIYHRFFSGTQRKTVR